LAGRSRLRRYASRLGWLLVVVVLTLLAVRIYDSQRGPPLELWHTFVPEELDAEALDAADWPRYLEAEDAVFADVRREVTEKLEVEERVPVNRYFEGSIVYPPRFAQDFNRSFVLEPEGEPAGVVVLLHGLTDSPYSQRHFAAAWRAHGFVAIAIRLPAHGTVPAALAEVEWEDWMAATRLAVREARRRVPAPRPLHIVGFSNGGALAVKYALDALDDPALPRADRLVLVSPMIGVTRFARFAGLTALPAKFPVFAKAAWLSVTAEFNPFKYNSFPVNGATQSHDVTAALQAQVARKARSGKIEGLPPILTFQSVLDFTVSTRAVITAFYDFLPANGSELVLFDVNRTSKFGPLLRRASESLAERLLPAPPRAYRTTVITNADARSTAVLKRVVEAGTSAEQAQILDLDYPIDVFSLSHVALPFPMSDGLYGLRPDPAEDFGLNLGTIAARGEIGALVVNMNAMLRMSSNPFFSFMLERIDEAIIADLPPAAPAPVAATGSP
jgi:alpha-beta hydrolase superfamily lysophospholipase